MPATLHTPLMSGANSIHGIVLVGAMLIAATADNPLSYVLAFIAVVFGAMNVVGGYVVTDRMLQMFRKKPVAPTKPDRGRVMSQEWIYTIVFLAWLAGAAAFVIGLHQMNTPATARSRQPALGRRHDAGRPRHLRLPGRPSPAASSTTAIVIIVVGFVIGGGLGL